jgi:hypothetical protein
MRVATLEVQREKIRLRIKKGPKVVDNKIIGRVNRIVFMQ